jgi:hypothetical protein
MIFPSCLATQPSQPNRTRLGASDSGFLLIGSTATLVAYSTGAKQQFAASIERLAERLAGGNAREPPPAEGRILRLALAQSPTGEDIGSGSG